MDTSVSVMVHRQYIMVVKNMDFCARLKHHPITYYVCELPDLTNGSNSCICLISFLQILS